MQDQQIVELFWRRSEEAVRASADKYGPYCRTVAKSLLADPRDAEECVNDAYLGTWDAIPPARPNPLLAFLCRIVRNLSLMRYHADRAAKRGGGSYTVALEELEGCLASPRTVEGDLEEQELVRLIEDFLETLSPENRVLLMRRYWFSDSYGEIAAQTGLSETNVSVRLTRIRKQLRHYFEERGVM